VDHKNTLVETRKKIGTDVLLLGNFDAYGLLVQGEAAAVAPAIKRCIDDGVDAVWPGCDIWPDVKPENVKAYVRTVRENGRAATAAVGRL
jgi:[methyl-Co(III) methanol-specific corrinoid protein]:coenzyme M methyltransferase